ncbi:uncharacterized protein RCC_08839 [Ramularia collo-cygni]|uniref:Uncharacterized protein n=1 Tax=Ramularia collo-cygni TaxID=112498 RepID=A0A2D3VIQ1_9PEZI|nr:uncharacterized protein RCC_08839 [Ramularia collo-cygni]CZT23129.1 uncharacterized protein RCC_08839 [Ramularia collo-cygni]
MNGSNNAAAQPSSQNSTQSPASTALSMIYLYHLHPPSPRSIYTLKSTTPEHPKESSESHTVPFLVANATYLHLTALVDPEKCQHPEDRELRHRLLQTVSLFEHVMEYPIVAGET